MKIREDQARVQELLKETITLLCKNGLNYKARFSVDALIGVTIDDSEVFLVNIKENVKNENAESDSSSDTESEAKLEKKSSNGATKGTPSRKRPPDDGGTRYSESSPLKKSRSNQDIDYDENDYGEDENDDGASNMSSNQTDIDSRIGVVKQEPSDEHDLVFVKQEQPDFHSTPTGNLHQSFTSPHPQPMSLFSQSGQQPPHDVNLDMSQDSSWTMNQSTSNIDPSNLANMSMASQSASQGGSNQIVCPHCCQIYKHRRSFRHHLAAVHGIGEQRSCEFCGETNFQSHTTFSRHLRKCKAAHEKDSLTLVPPDVPTNFVIGSFKLKPHRLGKEHSNPEIGIMPSNLKQ